MAAILRVHSSGRDPMKATRTLVLCALSSALVAGCIGASVDAVDEDRAADEPTESLRATATPAVLVSGTPVANLAAARGAELHFTLDVPAGATHLRFAISGGTGDADLYVRFAQAPTRTAYDFRPYLDGNNETVDVAAAKTGTYFAMVRGYTAYAGVTLVASFDPPTGGGGGGGGLDCHVAASWPADWVAFEDQVLTLVNQRRAAGATCGGVAKPAVGALASDDHLREASRCHSLDMGTNGYFAHDSQDGRSPWDRIRQAGYSASPTGEN